MTPLFLLRHGPTDAVVQGAPLGRTDLLVNAEAETRWPAVKAELRTLGLQRVICSPLQRSRLHAEDLELPSLVLPDLAEQSFGAWEGRPWAELSEADPIATKAFFADPVKAAPPEGESFARCASRAVMALQGALQGEAPTLVLAHGGSLRGLLAHFLGLPLERALDLAWAPYGLSLIEIYGPNRGLLRFHNRVLG
jgi:broad specificity phosphatase PhoE